jgi:hypothetical protein
MNDISYDFYMLQNEKYREDFEAVLTELTSSTDYPMIFVLGAHWR